MRASRRLLATVVLVLAAALAAGPLAMGAVASPTTDHNPSQAYVRARQLEHDVVPLTAATVAPATPAAIATSQPLGAVAVVLLGAAGGFAGGLAAVAAWRARARQRPRRTAVPA